MRPLEALFTAAVILASCFTVAGWAQPPSTAPAASPPPKPVTKKAAPKAKAAAKPPVAEIGPCRLGIISVVEDRFAVQKFGLTVFETEESAVAVNGWGLDDLAVRQSVMRIFRLVELAGPGRQLKAGNHPLERRPVPLKVVSGGCGVRQLIDPPQGPRPIG